MGDDSRRPECIPVILAGGSGTRLWPVSREARPKHFLRLNGEHSLLQSTLRRAAAIADGEILVAINADHFFQVEDEVRALAGELAGVRLRYLLEPEARNTGPALAAVAQWVSALHGDDAMLVALPADHLIGDEAELRRAIDAACRSAAGGMLVALAVPPTEPETAFGYLLPEDSRGQAVRKVRRFIEKPDATAARRLVDSGYLWNSGIFCALAGALNAAFSRHAPGLHRGIAACRRRSRVDDAGHLRMDAAAFAALPDVSVDHALLEKVDKLAVVVTDPDWTDIGTWQAMSRLVAADGAGNRHLGEAVLIGCRDTYVQSDGRLVAAVGVNNLVIVDTPDALLVGSRDDVQKVREVVDRLRLDGHESHAVHRTVHRPWGTFTVIEEGERHKIKRLCVRPGRSLSLQMHYHRSEHWVVLQGQALVTNGEREFLLETDQSTYIPAGNRHRLENAGPGDLVIVETQTGSYLGEDDIVRFEDAYGRTGAEKPLRRPDEHRARH